MANRLVRATREGVTFTLLGKCHPFCFNLDNNPHGIDGQNQFRGTWNLYGSGVRIRGSKTWYDSTLRDEYYERED